MTQDNSVVVRRGLYGEVLPPVMIGGLAPEEAVRELKAAISGSGELPDDLDAGSLESMAAAYAQNRLADDLLAGRREAASAEEQAFVDVLLAGVPVSLCSLGMDALVFRGFAPVLIRLGETAWQIGLSAYGQVEVFAEPDAGEAVARARRLYVEWSEIDAEEQSIEDDATIRLAPYSPFYPYWQFLLASSGYWQCGGYGVELARPNSGLIALHLPSGGMRLIQVSAADAVRLAHALARRDNRAVQEPDPRDVAEWLNLIGARPPQAVEWDNRSPIGLPARIFKGDDILTLREESETLFPRLIVADEEGTVLRETPRHGTLSQWMRRDRDSRLAAAALLTFAL